MVGLAVKGLTQHLTEIQKVDTTASQSQSQLEPMHSPAVIAFGNYSSFANFIVALECEEDWNLMHFDVSWSLAQS